MKKVVFLASGNGGNFKFLYLAIQHKIIPKLNLYVIADRDCGSIQFAQKNKIENKIINYTRNSPESLINALTEISPDIIITNWHKIIDEKTVSLFSGKLVNLHYSLLPTFSGLIGIEPISRAYKQGCQFIGATCHFVDDGVDTGNIISQSVFTISHIKFDDAVKLMFETGCLILLNSILMIVSQSKPPEQPSNMNNVLFSPPLTFETSKFSKDFWRELASV